MFRYLIIEDNDQARQLLALQKISYKVEADLIRYSDLPPLNDTLEILQNSKETFCGYYDGARLVGAISYERRGDVLDICRLMVHPEFFRREIAQTMLQEIDGMEKAEIMTVSTGSKNIPALKFYQRYGFVAQGEREVASGIFITSLKK
ncbi:MAG TPA: GNAT family N-acetyltransferase [Desulfosporosinus sp.]